MWLLVAEAVIALGMLVFVVWWTIGTRRKADADRVAQAAPPPLPPPTPVSPPPGPPPSPPDRSAPGD